MKKLKVTMAVVLNNEADVKEIKKWEHHIEYAIDMDSYPEINHIEDVRVNEASEVYGDKLYIPGKSVTCVSEFSFIIPLFLSTVTPGKLPTC